MSRVGDSAHLSDAWWWSLPPNADIVVDCAGGPVGGMRRYLDELERWVDRQHAPVRPIGYGRGLGARWLLRRELEAHRSRPSLVVALNNVSFVTAGQLRTVLLRNAIHFLSPGELQDRRSQLRFAIAKGPIVRAALRRADRIVVPSASMADRVTAFSPNVAHRLEILHNPVRPLDHCSANGSPIEGRILCPVVDGPHKRLGVWLGEAIAALLCVVRSRKRPVQLEVTLDASQARRQGLPEHPWVSYLGLLSSTEMRRRQRTARTIFYPADVESFGYPLAEARVNRQPVVAPDTPLCHEIAGDALVAYRPGDLLSLVEAFDTALEVRLPALDHNPFDPDAHFERLFGL
jgi:glycosyltransferase involved in cell wall biosynthesis